MIVRTITVTCDSDRAVTKQGCPAALIVPPGTTQVTLFAIAHGWAYDVNIETEDGGGMLCPEHRPRKVDACSDCRDGACTR